MSEGVSLNPCLKNHLFSLSRFEYLNRETWERIDSTNRSWVQQFGCITICRPVFLSPSTWIPHHKNPSYSMLKHDISLKGNNFSSTSLRFIYFHTKTTNNVIGFINTSWTRIFFILGPKLHNVPLLGKPYGYKN